MAPYNKRMQRTGQSARDFALPLMRGVEPVEKLLKCRSL
jgi:hypothetical protein